jgi:hypothetical protein
MSTSTDGRMTQRLLRRMNHRRVRRASRLHLMNLESNLRPLQGNINPPTCETGLFILRLTSARHENEFTTDPNFHTTERGIACIPNNTPHPYNRLGQSSVSVWRATKLIAGPPCNIMAS